MQYPKLPVSSQLQNSPLLEQSKVQAASIKNYKALKSFKALGLIASISSLGATVSFTQPAQAKASISSINGKTLIAELPPLDISTTVGRNQNPILMGDVALEKPASTILIKPNPHQEITTQGIPQLPALEVAQIERKEASKKIHTVQPGDTIAGIARQYGISSSQIIEANKLTNPNLLKINRQLLIPSLELAQENSYPKIEISSDRQLPSLQQKQKLSLENNFFTSNSTKPASISSLTEKKAESRYKKRALESIVTSPTEPEEQTSQTTVPQDSNSYISRLRQDIIQLRTRYQNQNNSGDTTAATPTTEPKEQAVTKVTSEVIIPVPTSASINSSEANNKVTTNSTPQTQSIASAPNSAENFTLIDELSGTSTVAPDLPPLASPEEYLPNNPVFDGYMWPAQGTLTSGYGWRWGRMHKGIDIAAPIGTPIMAAAPGEVIFAGWNSGGYGNLVKLRHPDGSVTFYAHNNRVLVRNGQSVRQGQLIAEMGSTGRSTGPHLHFEIRPNGTNAINPIALLTQN